LILVFKSGIGYRRRSEALIDTKEKRPQEERLSRSMQLALGRGKPLHPSRRIRGEEIYAGKLERHYKKARKRGEEIKGRRDHIHF